MTWHRTTLTSITQLQYCNLMKEYVQSSLCHADQWYLYPPTRAILACPSPVQSGDHICTVCFCVLPYHCVSLSPAELTWSQKWALVQGQLYWCVWARFVVLAGGMGLDIWICPQVPFWSCSTSMFPSLFVVVFLSKIIVQIFLYLVWLVMICSHWNFSLSILLQSPMFCRIVTPFKSLKSYVFIWGWPLVEVCMTAHFLGPAWHTLTFHVRPSIHRKYVPVPVT